MAKLTKESLKTLVKEELTSLVTEAKGKEKKISETLEDMRTNLFKEMLELESLGENHPHRLERRIQLSTVSEVTGFPVNELMLYFINEIKTKPTRSLVEYHLGHVYFYSC